MMEWKSKSMRCNIVKTIKSDKQKIKPTFVSMKWWEKKQKNTKTQPQHSVLNTHPQYGTCIFIPLIRQTWCVSIFIFIKYHRNRFLCKEIAVQPMWMEFVLAKQTVQHYVQSCASWNQKYVRYVEPPYAYCISMSSARFHLCVCSSKQCAVI